MTWSSTSTLPSPNLFYKDTILEFSGQSINQKVIYINISCTVLLVLLSLDVNSSPHVKIFVITSHFSFHCFFYCTNTQNYNSKITYTYIRVYMYTHNIYIYTRTYKYINQFFF